MPRSCSETMFMQYMGIAEECPDNNCGPRAMVDRAGREYLIPLSRDPNTGRLGYHPRQWGHRGAPPQFAAPPSGSFKGNRDPFGVGDNEERDTQNSQGVEYLRITTPDELKNMARKFYDKYQKKFARCIWEVFSKDKDGNPSDVAKIMARQIFKNAPLDRFILGRTSAQIGGQGRLHSDGMISLASDIRSWTLDNGRQVSAEESFFRTYAHEVSNYLSWLYVGDGNAFGTQNGIQGRVVESGRRSMNVDKDTGARMENCMWGDVSY